MARGWHGVCGSTRRSRDQETSANRNNACMNTLRMQRDAAGRLLWLALAVLLVRPLGANTAGEETFPLLQIGTRTYTNVTVTTKAKDYVFILHAGGMNNIKLAELPADIQVKLGYASAIKLTSGTNSTAAWAAAKVAKLETPQIKEVRTKLERQWRGGKAPGFPVKAIIGSKVFLALLGIVLLVYLFHCYCFMLICQKAGHPPGVLIWIPIVQFIPMLRAAGMSAWWFVAYLLPVLNLVAIVLWSINIVKARGKSVWVTVCLILPLTCPFAMLYLAFSDGAAGADEDDREPQVMSLQAV
jgi:hypothetical protein